MSIAGVTLVTAVRAAAISVLAVGGAVKGVRFLRTLRAPVAGAYLWLTLLVFLFPSMLIGYHAAATRSAGDAGWAKELHYSFLVLIRVSQLALLLVWLTPPVATFEGARAFTLMGRLPVPERWRWKVRGWFVGFWPIIAVVFICAFQEFDLAACLNARSWTIALFDAQAGGLALTESLKLMLWPVALECVALGVLVFRVQTGMFARSGYRGEVPRRARSCEFLWTLPMLGVLYILLAGPLVTLRDGWLGLPALAENFALSGEVTNSFLLALVSSVAAWFLAAWSYGHRSRVVLLVLPGLLGGMIVSLGLLALFQVPPLHLLRATPIPVLLALVLLLMPSALFVRHLLVQGMQSEAVHVATLGRVSAVRWTMVKRPALWGGALLFLQAYGDFTANSMLAPATLTSAFSRIFNLMHYGQTTVLTAMLLVTIAAPLLALLLTSLAVRTYASRRDS